MKLIIELSLDNEAMTDSEVVALLVHRIARNLEGGITWTEHDDGSWTAVPSSKHPVSDINGNKVGFWEITSL